MSIEHIIAWMAPIIQYLTQGILSKNANEARNIKKVPTRYLIISDRLYKIGRSTSMLRCVVEEKVTLVMNEVHEGACRSHIGGRALSGKKV